MRTLMLRGASALLITLVLGSTPAPAQTVSTTPPLVPIVSSALIPQGKKSWSYKIVNVCASGQRLFIARAEVFPSPGSANPAGWKVSINVPQPFVRLAADGSTSGSGTAAYPLVFAQGDGPAKSSYSFAVPLGWDGTLSVTLASPLASGNFEPTIVTSGFCASTPPQTVSYKNPVVN